MTLRSRRSDDSLLARQQQFASQDPPVHFTSISPRLGIGGIGLIAWIPDPDGRACYLRLTPRYWAADLLSYLDVVCPVAG